MNYFFPSFLAHSDLNSNSGKLDFTVNNGENAIRLLLRNFGLKKGSKVVIPLFVCDSLKKSVLKEGLEPFYVDLKADGSFWADYSNISYTSEPIAAVILVHLYGYLHPDTELIMNQCKQLNLPLIHDAAQSFGIDESQLTYSSGIVYSFGAGKSTTAAGGAIVKGLEKSFYDKNIKIVSDFSLQTIHSKLFFKSRVYGYHFSLKDKLSQAIFSRIHENEAIKSMTPFQEKSALASIRLLSSKKATRIKNFEILKIQIVANDNFKVTSNQSDGAFFKIIFTIKKNEAKFKSYLSKNNVPFFCLYDSMKIHNEQFNNYPVFKSFSGQIIELSTEASIPSEEINRIAEILKKYKD